jgi:hypothetical protein
MVDRTLRTHLTRRQVLAGGALAATGLAASGCVIDGELVPLEDIIGLIGPTFTTTIKRKQDLLDLTVEGFNVRQISTDDGPRLVKIVSSRPAFLVFVFTSQSTMERAIPEDDPLPAPPIGSASAGSTRLAFFLPADGVPLTTEALLNWPAFDPRLVPVASGIADPTMPGGIGTGPSTPQIREPLDFETAIEMPWRLMLSPHAELNWAHATGLVTHTGRTEVWHTRLGVRDGGSVDEWEADGRTIQAIWTPDLVTSINVSFETALHAGHRVDIVESTSDLELEGNAPATVNRLMLSPVGGWLDVNGEWDTTIGLEQWIHRTSMGRDHYVRVVEKGFLYPYGHRASLFTVTERKLEPAFGDVGAYLRQRQFIIVREPVKDYGATTAQPNDGRDWPFASVRLTTLVTPTLDGETSGEIIEVGGQPLLFHAVGTDAEGHEIDFTTPMVWVELGDAQGGVDPGSVDDFEIALGGQTVTLAEPDPDEPGRTALELSHMTVGALGPAGADPMDLANAGEAPFYPRLVRFGSRLAAAESVSGSSAGAPEFEIAPTYVTDGFGGGNPAGVFAVMPDGGTAGINFPADKAGGIATPNLDVNALSRELGSTFDSVTGGEFNPEDFFPPGAAKLLGGIELAHVIQQTQIVPGEAKALKITSRPEHDDPAQPPVAVITELQWDPDLKADLLGLFDPSGATMHLDATFRQDLVDLAASTYEINGLLNNFALNLIGDGPAHFMTVQFELLEFRAATNEKSDLRPELSNVTFHGPLQFVERIQEFLTFGDGGPDISFDGDGIRAGYSLPLPQIPLGSVMLNNITMNASVMIPWSGDPAKIRFGLSSRENPFDITYSCIGGGGFFGIAFGLDGLEKFECSLELGAYVSMDIGVLSGSISIAGGLYFAIEFVEVDGEELTKVGLTAYIRFVGKVQALGLVAVSLELYLSLGFELVGDAPKVVGVAWAEFKIRVLIFSGKIRVKVERRISATPNDPTFADLYDEPHWVGYVNAFAPIGG